MGKVKVKFSTNFRDEDTIYKQGKSYELPYAFARSLIISGIVVEAPRNAQKNEPEKVVTKAAANDTKGRK